MGLVKIESVDVRTEDPQMLCQS